MSAGDQLDGRGFVPLAAAARRLGYDATDWRSAARAFPVRWPEAYLELAASPAGAPVRRMGVPDPAELAADPGDLADPVGEAHCQPVPFVVRKHADRAILVVTSRCHFYCRFCFRRAFPGGQHRDPTQEELKRAVEYLRDDPEMREVILSGGDPLVLTDEALRAVVVALAASPRITTVRVHTRAPVHHPERVGTDLVEALRAGPTPWVVTHFNHPVELTPAAVGAVDRLLAGGIPVLDQSVLLSGVNDSVDVLAELFRSLYARRVKPYYLHHPDRAPGNASFRVSLARGLALYGGLRQRVTGPALPAYVIDLPDGSGKVPVESLTRLDDGRYRSPGGCVFADVPEVG